MREPRIAERSAGLGTVAIVGAGQVGTMLGMALRGSAVVGEVALFDRDVDAAVRSADRGAGTRLLEDVDEALSMDTVILALPIPEIVAFAERFGPALRPGAFLIDTGSAKAEVVRAFRRSVPPPVHAIGGHPMAGTERAGPEGADPDALRGATFVLTPVREDPDALAGGRLLAEAVGARPVVMDAGAHDRIVARTSHLPHVMAFALAEVVGRVKSDVLQSMASSGYEGAVRLAGSDPEMIAGFLAANHEEIGRAVAELGEALARLATAAAEGPESVAAVLAEGRAARERTQR